MADDLRVALRINANAGNSRREIEQLNRNLRRAGREGAAGLSREAVRAGASLQSAGRKGSTAFRQTRADMRGAANDGSMAFKRASTQITSAVEQVVAELRQLRETGGRSAYALQESFQDTQRRGIGPMRDSVDRTNVSFRRLARTGGRELGTLKRLASGVRGEFDRLRQFGGSTMGMLGVAGGGYLAASQLKQSALLDRQLIRTQQTAGMTPEQREQYRTEGYRIGRAYGVDPRAIYTGGDTLLAAGLSPSATLESVDAIGQATAITGADSSILGSALVAGASAYDIDLSQPQAALDMLQQMIVAGRLGNAELENLADIFPKVGANAKAAGMSFPQSLAYLETLSAVEQQPDRLGTLADSGLRIFTNQQYRERITKTSGVEFFNPDGSARDTSDVYGDLQRKYNAMSSDEERARFFGTVFKGMDMDTVRANRIMLSGGRLDTYNAHTQAISNPSDDMQRDLQQNIESASGAGGRARAAIGQAMDEMMRPINAALADAGSYLLDDLGLDGKDMLLAGAVGGAALYGGARGAGALGSKLFGGANTLKNIAVGTALEEATGVQPVYITNWPARMGVGGPGSNADIDAPGNKRSRSRPGSSPRGGGWRNPLGNAGRLAKWGAPLTLAMGGFNAIQIAKDDSLNANEKAIAQAKNTGGTGGALVGASAGFMFGGPLGALLGGAAGHVGGSWLGAQLPDWLGGDAAIAEKLAAPTFGHDTPATTPLALPPALSGVEQRLSALLDKPLVIELRGDMDWIYADVEQRAGIQARRGQ